MSQSTLYKRLILFTKWKLMNSTKWKLLISTKWKLNISTKWTNLEIGDLVSKGYPSISRRLCPTVTDARAKVQLDGGQSLITQPACFPETMQPEEL